MENQALMTIKKIEINENQKISGKLNLKYSIDNIHSEIQHQPMIKNNKGIFYDQKIKIKPLKSQSVLYFELYLKKKYQQYQYGKLKLDLNEIRKKNEYNYKMKMENQKKNVFIQFDIRFLSNDKEGYFDKKIQDKSQNSSGSNQKRQNFIMDIKKKTISKNKNQKYSLFYSQLFKQNQENQEDNSRDKTPKKIIKRTHQTNISDKNIINKSYKKTIKDSHQNIQSKLFSSDSKTKTDLQNLLTQSKTKINQHEIQLQKLKLQSSLNQKKHRNPTHDLVMQMLNSKNAKIFQKNKQKKNRIFNSAENIFNNTQSIVKAEEDSEMTLKNNSKLSDYKNFHEQNERIKKNQRQKNLKQQRQLKQLQQSLKHHSQMNLNMRDIILVGSISEDQQSKILLQQERTPESLLVLNNKLWQLSIKFEKNKIIYYHPEKLITVKQKKFFQQKIFLGTFILFFLITLLNYSLEK